MIAKILPVLTFSAHGNSIWIELVLVAIVFLTKFELNSFISHFTKTVSCLKTNFQIQIRTVFNLSE